MQPRFLTGLIQRRIGAPALTGTAWAVVNQAVVSGGTFFTNVILARTLPQADYGIFVLLLTVGFSLLNLANCVCGYPLAVRLATARGAEVARLAASSILTALTLCLPLLGVIWLVLFYLGRDSLVVPSLLWFFLWSMQQSTRRAFLSDLRQREALIGDALCNFGQVALLALFASTLTLTSALYILATAAGAGAILQAVQLRLFRSGVYGPVAWLRHSYSIGSASILAAALLWSVRGFAPFWLLTAVSGPSATADLQAVMIVFNALNPLCFSICNVLSPVAARAYGDQDPRAAWSATRPYVVLVLPPIVLFLMLTVLFPHALLATLYGSQSPYAKLGYLFPYLALCTAATVSADLLNAFFLGIQKAKLILRVNALVLAGVAALIPFAFLAVGPLVGICLALACGEIARLGALLLWLKRLLRKPAVTFYDAEHEFVLARAVQEGGEL